MLNKMKSAFGGKRIFLTIALFVAMFAGLAFYSPSKVSAAGIGDSIRPFVSQETADTFTMLFNNQLKIANEVVEADFRDDIEVRTEAEGRLNENSQALDSFLTNLEFNFPIWP